MNPLTIAELRLKHAQLTERAERLEVEWRTLPPTGKAIALGKKVKLLREQAADYGELLGTVTRQDKPDHVCNSVQARGEMDEPLGYLICGICGKPKGGARS